MRRVSGLMSDDTVLARHFTPHDTPEGGPHE